MAEKTLADLGMLLRVAAPWRNPGGPPQQEQDNPLFPQMPLQGGFNVPFWNQGNFPPVTTQANTYPGGGPVAMDESGRMVEAVPSYNKVDGELPPSLLALHRQPGWLRR